MADEKRRLIYELLVEAKGAGKAKAELESFSKQLGQLGDVAKGFTGIFAGAFALKGIGESLDELTKFNQGMAALGVSGAAATQALHGIQDIAFKTGNSMAGVTEVYKEAVQLQGQLGRSTEDAARTTDAFIRIANSEGKSAQSAAQAVQTLAFALESGVLPAKQFSQMLKDSPTFARAAQEALGKTTEQLVEMAKGSDLTRVSLTEVVLAMEHIGEKTEAAVTVGGLVESLKVLTTTIIQATAEGANFNAVVSGGQTGWQSFMESVRGLFTFIGGAIAVVSNFVQEMINVARLFTLTMASGDIVGTWRKFNAEVENDLIDMGRGFAAMWDQVKAGFEDAPAEISEVARVAEQEAKDMETRRIARDKQLAKERDDLNKSRIKSWTDAAEKARDDAREFLKKEAEDEKKRNKESIDSYVAMLEEKGRLAKIAAKERAEDEKEIQKGLDDFKKQAEEDLQKEMDNAKPPDLGIPQQFFHDIDAATEAAFVLKDTFADLFTGGIHNARQFFQVILAGLAQVFAQIAAQRIAQGIMDAVLGGAKLAGGGGPVLFAAKGAAFQGGRPIPFAQGGVVSAPTTFPMANGGTGLMGEAGPEAVMPLKRMSNGKLGVSGGMPNIQIINKLGVAAKGRVEKDGDRMAIVLEAAQLGASMAEDRFNRSLRTGYGTAAQSVQSVYGLRRKV